MRVRRSRHYLQGFLATLLIVAASILFAALPASQAHATVVSRIDVEGNQRVDAETIRAYVVIRPGKSFGSAEEDASLKALFETGLFSDVNLDVRGAVLVVIVVENPVINEVAFEGNKKFKDDQLKNVVQSAARGVFTRAPRVAEVGPEVEVLASLDGEPVLLRDGRVLVASFHPELTDDTRVHERFLDLVREEANVRA